jgi:transcriptional regulator with XRE-family HTH domain
MREVLKRLIERGVSGEPEVPSSEFAGFVQFRRRQFGLNRAQFADLLGIDKEVLFLLEHGLLRSEEFSADLEALLRVVLGLGWK